MSDDRYTNGRSTPRPVRFNDLLWSDFARYARKRGLTAADALREAMIEVIDRNGAASIQKSLGERMRTAKTPSGDLLIEIELG